MFKNATLYRIGDGPDEWAPQMDLVLERGRFVPCGPTQPVSIGWVPPREENGVLYEVIDGQIIMKLMVETKAVPAGILKREVKKIADRIERETGRKPGKKQTKEIKEEALLALLPPAFPKQATILVWIDRKNSLMLVDTPSQSQADIVVTAMVQSLPGLTARLVDTDVSPAAGMAHWLMEREAPADFSVDRECELHSSDEIKTVVKYARYGLDADDVVEQVAGGMIPTRLAMTWNGRVSFVLTEGGQLRKLEFLDVVFETAEGNNRADEFDANVSIATGEMRKLIPALAEALGGERAAA